MFKFIKYLGIGAILTTNIFASSLIDNISSSLTNYSQLSNPINNISSVLGNDKINVSDMAGMGNLPFSLECNNDIDLNIDGADDVCSNYKNLEGQTNKFLSLLSKGKSALGCTIVANEKNKCRSEMIRKMCSNAENLDNKTVFGTASNNLSNKENMLFTGGDYYLKGNVCGQLDESIKNEIKYGNKTNKQIEEDYLSPQAIGSKVEAGGTSAYWKPGKLNLYETCIKNALSKGVRNPEESCKGEFYALPKDRLEVKEQIATTVKTSLRDSSNGLTKKVSDIEKTLEMSQFKGCSNGSNGECTDSSYLNSQKQLQTMIKGEETEKIKQIEEEMASFQETLKIATMPKYEITYPTQEILNGLHPEKKADFVVAANKQMHQKALFNASIQNLTDLKKELVELSFRKAELSNNTFYPNLALEEAQKIMNSGY